MKFNTLTFDANLPTTQQVNVPTNTDYKVGMKVKRNGEVQQLGPDEITIYTGEINVIPPTQFTAETKECENSSAMQFLNLKDDALSAVAGKRIKSTDIWVEFSFDNGTTWTKGIVDQYTVPVKVNDRASGSNNYIASVNLSNPTQWTLLDHNTPTGEYADYVTVPEVPYIMIQFLGSNFTNITSYPCLWRLVFLYGGQEIPVTIPTDADKTNGYVTFTQAAGDEASCKEYTVDVDTTDYTTIHGGTKRTSANLLMDYFNLSSYPELSGQNIYGKNIRVLYSDAEDGDYKDINYTKMDPAFFVDFRDPAQTTVSRYRWFGNSVQGGIPMDWRIVSYVGGVATIVDSIKIDPSIIDRVIFYCQPGPAHTLSDVCPDFVGTPSASNPIWIKLVIKVGDIPLIAKFKLVENIYKSQCGDINVQTDPDFNTAKVEGTYADGTEFSFDFCIQ